MKYLKLLIIFSIKVFTLYYTLYIIRKKRRKKENNKNKGGGKYMRSIALRNRKSVYLMIVIIFISMLISYRTVSASNDFIIDDGVLIRYIGSSDNVEIPDDVTEIHADVFRNNAFITKVIIPESVTKIGANAFSKCTSLEDIKIPESVTTIGKEVFMGCISLKSIEIPKSVKVIAEGAFQDCPLLKNIIISEGVTEIESRAFGNIGSADLVLPVSIEAIGKNVFEYSRIRSIKILSSIERIESGTFFECKKLKRVSLPDTLTYIGDAAFCHCKALSQIEIPASVNQMSGGAFTNCSSLKAIVIPEALNTLENSTIIDCKNMERVTIPKSTAINNNAFLRCTSIVIYGFENSPAQTYAKENNIEFKVLALNKTNDKVAIGKTIQLTLNSLAKCTWTSSNKSIAKVNSKGIVTGVKKGTAKITAELYGERFICTIKVQ